MLCCTHKQGVVPPTNTLRSYFGSHSWRAPTYKHTHTRRDLPSHTPQHSHVSNAGLRSCSGPTPRTTPRAASPTSRACARPLAGSPRCRCARGWPRWSRTSRRGFTWRRERALRRERRRRCRVPAAGCQQQAAGRGLREGLRGATPAASSCLPVGPSFIFAFSFPLPSWAVLLLLIPTPPFPSPQAKLGMRPFT